MKPFLIACADLDRLSFVGAVPLGTAQPHYAKTDRLGSRNLADRVGRNTRATLYLAGRPPACSFIQAALFS